MQVTIRKAHREDIHFFQISLALETENIVLEQAIVEAGLKALFDDPAKGIYHVAHIDTEIVGCYMITFEWSDWKNGWTYWLQSVYVKAPFRRSGVLNKCFRT